MAFGVWRVACGVRRAATGGGRPASRRQQVVVAVLNVQRWFRGRRTHKNDAKNEKNGRRDAARQAFLCAGTRTCGALGALLVVHVMVDHGRRAEEGHDPHVVHQDHQRRHDTEAHDLSERREACAEECRACGRTGRRWRR